MGVGAKPQFYLILNFLHGLSSLGLNPFFDALSFSLSCCSTNVNKYDLLSITPYNLLSYVLTTVHFVPLLKDITSPFSTSTGK